MLVFFTLTETGLPRQRCCFLTQREEKRMFVLMPFYFDKRALFFDDTESGRAALVKSIHGSMTLKHHPDIPKGVPALFVQAVQPEKDEKCIPIINMIPNVSVEGFQDRIDGCILDGLNIVAETKIMNF